MTDGGYNGSAYYCNESYVFKHGDVVVFFTTSGHLLGVTSIVLNVFFLSAMRFVDDRSTAYHRLIQNLAVADIMASLLFLVTQSNPVGLFGTIDPEMEFLMLSCLPYVFRGTPWVFITGYLLTLSLLSVNQYVGVCKPWRYSQLVTRRAVGGCLVVLWLVSSLQVAVPFVILLILWGIDDKKDAQRLLYQVSSIEMQAWMVVFAASTLLNIVLNMFVHQKIRSLKLRHHDTRGAPNPESLNIRMKQEAFVTVSLLLIASVFCRMPFPVVSLVALNLGGMSCDPEDLKMEDQMNAVVILLLYVTFFADPIIYLSRIRDTRNSYKALFRKARARLACCRSNSFETQCDGVAMNLVSPREKSQSTLI